MAVGALTVAAPIAMQAIKSKSVTPVTTAATNLNVWKTAVIRSAGGYAGGYIAGMVIDHTPLKKPVNKGLKMVGMR